MAAGEVDLKFFVSGEVGESSVDGIGGQDEVDAVRRRARRKILGPERRRARAAERIGQPDRILGG